MSVLAINIFKMNTLAFLLGRLMLPHYLNLNVFYKFNLFMVAFLSIFPVGVSEKLKIVKMFLGT